MLSGVQCRLLLFVDQCLDVACQYYHLMSRLQIHHSPLADSRQASCPVGRALLHQQIMSHDHLCDRGPPRLFVKWYIGGSLDWLLYQVIRLQRLPLNPINLLGDFPPTAILSSYTPSTRKFQLHRMQPFPNNNDRMKWISKLLFGQGSKFFKCSRDDPMRWSSNSR